MKKTTSKATRMFSALVLGGGMILDPAAAAGKSKPNGLEVEPSQAQELNKKQGDYAYCQLEFTLNKYAREGVDHEVTCLDELSEAEIKKVIDNAREQTCNSAFCGCWLG